MNYPFEILIGWQNSLKIQDTVDSAFNETEWTLQMNSLKAEFAIQDMLILQSYSLYCR